MTAEDRAKAANADDDAVELYRLDDQVGFLMRIVNQRHTALFMSRMVAGLTPPQFATLAKLREVGPCSQNRLGRLVYLDAATIKGVVDRLIGRGFVMTADDPLDRRRRAIGLTDSGMTTADQAIEAAKAISAATLEPLSPEEREQIIIMLKKLS
ncbi:MarR family winged helix-turn-helix transcriptional regulator [Ancylobacter pratisalsi]|uniref:MarR family transcriptional regulator n=1 Tax=Ancylobacter pratisalsi TaxID=1745854 RepID=A0A6P1YNG9_9HYPH|nr:MarR family transcriptional regulator [Ancylobacter pratisalsi]QIB33763.1 MarR family transcriptional regulator [Ancylobacter pratisalsi]